MKFNDTLMKLVKKDLEQGNIPMLLGEPGIGKSSWVIALGQLLHTQVFVLPCNQMADKADITGARLVPVLDKNGNPTDEYKQVFYPHAIISDAIAYAEEHPRETPILFMDELNRTTPDVTSECLSIPTLRAIGNKSLPKNLRVVTAGNDKGNITSLDEASISRFVLYPVTPDVNTFLALDKELNPFVKATLQHHPECIFCKAVKVAAGKAKDDDDEEVDIDEILEDGEDMNQLTTPRTITGVSRWLNSFTNAELMELLADSHTDPATGEDVTALQEALEGHTGRTNFTVFLLQEITANIMTTNNQSTTIQVAKPSCYDQMKACTDRTTLEEFVDTMTPNEMSGCMVYLLHEKEDNAPYITAIAQRLPKLERPDVNVLSQLMVAQMIDEGNSKALLDTNTTLSNTLAVLIDQQ